MTCLGLYALLFKHCWCTGAPHLGAVIIPVDKVVSGEKIEGWFDLEAPTTKVRGKPMKAQVCSAPCFTSEIEVSKLNTGTEDATCAHVANCHAADLLP